MPLDVDAICSDADLAVVLGQSVNRKARTEIAERDALRQVALEDTVRAYEARTPPITLATMEALTLPQQIALLKAPVRARAMSLACDGAMSVANDRFDVLSRRYNAEWISYIGGSAADAGGGGTGGTTDPVVRAAALVVRARRR